MVFVCRFHKVTIYMGLRLVSDWISGVGDRILGALRARRLRMYKKASSELVVARRRRGADNGRQHVRVAAADRVQGPLGEDDGDDAVERDDRRVPRARERVVVEAEDFSVGLDDAVAEVLDAAAQDDVEGARVFALVVGSAGTGAASRSPWRSGWCPSIVLI